MPRSRARAVLALAEALASGGLSLDPGADRDAVTSRLLALPGIGPWTAGYIGMRALSDPDAYPPGDAGVLRALRRLGVAGETAAASWRPWRAYAVHQLWSSLEPAADGELHGDPTKGVTI
jgi:AraC family transcriptional regulator, regulatory protein of adaptative response / DNA-3-methyladenine glycosylase II